MDLNECMRMHAYFACVVHVHAQSAGACAQFAWGPGEGPPASSSVCAHMALANSRSSRETGMQQKECHTFCV